MIRSGHGICRCIGYNYEFVIVLFYGRMGGARPAGGRQRRRRDGGTAGRHSLNKILLTKDSVYNSKSYFVCTLFVGCKGVVLCVAGAELRTTCRLRTTVRGSMA